MTIIDMSSKPEYIRIDKFFDYAFPEGKLFSDTSYEYLNQAGYTTSLMNHLMSDLRRTIESQESPGIKVLLLDAPHQDLFPAINLDKHLKENIEVRDIYSRQRDTVVVICPFIYNAHWYTTVIHLTNTIPGSPIVRAIITNPYGSSHFNEEAQRKIEEQINNFIAPSLIRDNNKKIDFAVLHASDDIQGFNEDNINCGPITVYVIQKYIQNALSDFGIEGHKTLIQFDKFRDGMLNQKVHKALMFRLKIAQISKINTQEIDDTLGLCFRDALHGDIERAKKIKADVEVLSRQIVNATSQLYSSHAFFNTTNVTGDQQNITKLNISDQMELLNRIAVAIVHDTASNVFQPFPFKKILDSAVNVFMESPASSLEKHKEGLKNIIRQLENNLRGFEWRSDSPSEESTIDGEKLQRIPQTQPSELDVYHTELVKSVGQGFESYKTYINQLSKENLKIIINMQDERGLTVAMRAVIQGEKDILFDLVQNGADLSLSCDRYQIGTWMYYIPMDALDISLLEANNIEISKYLIEHLEQTLSPESFSSRLTEALGNIVYLWMKSPDKFLKQNVEAEHQFLKSLSGDSSNDDERGEVIKLLLNKGANPCKEPDDSNEKEYCAPLACAVSENNLAIVKYILDNKQELVDYALGIAAKGGKCNVFKEILDKYGINDIQNIKNKLINSKGNPIPLSDKAQPTNPQQIANESLRESIIEDLEKRQKRLAYEEKKRGRENIDDEDIETLEPRSKEPKIIPETYDIEMREVSTLGNMCDE